MGCIDHFVRQADIQAAYCPPYWKYAVGEEGQWVTTLYRRGKALKIEAASRGEMVYNLLEDVLDQCPTYDSFLRWYCYPSLSDTVLSLSRHLELIRQLLPLQTHVDRQLFNARVQCVLEVVSLYSDETADAYVALCVICNRSCALIAFYQLFRVRYLLGITKPCWVVAETLIWLQLSVTQSSGFLRLQLVDNFLQNLDFFVILIFIPGSHCNSNPDQCSQYNNSCCNSCVHEPSFKPVPRCRVCTRLAQTWRPDSLAHVWRGRLSGDSCLWASTWTTSRTASELILTMRYRPTCSCRT